MGPRGRRQILGVVWKLLFSGLALQAWPLKQAVTWASVSWGKDGASTWKQEELGGVGPAGSGHFLTRSSCCVFSQT